MISLDTVKRGTVLSVAILLCAFIYRKHSDHQLFVVQEKLTKVHDGLKNREQSVPPFPRRIAVGLGGCRDLLVPATSFLKETRLFPSGSSVHHDYIDNETALENVFSYFFRRGAAAERYVSNKALMKKLVEDASYMDPRIARWRMGGNAPVMAKRFAMEGASVLLGARLHPKAEAMLDSRIKFSGGEALTDDVHVILEYKTGEKWGDLTAPRANRFIFHSDQTNPRLLSLERFIKDVREYEPHLLVISGLQMMEHFPFQEGEVENRLMQLQTLLETLPPSSRVHFELASFTDEHIIKEFLFHAVRFSDSLGMNEQELANLETILVDNRVTIVADPYPRIARTLDSMRKIYSILSQTDEGEGRRKLSRLHVHTIAYQAILVRKGSGWKNTAAAASKAALVANRHTCQDKQVNITKAYLIMDDSFKTSKDPNKAEQIHFNDTNPVSCWTEDEFEICIAPVLVCQDVVQTCGGGDNISAAGLILQI